MLIIRLQRVGKRNEPVYRLVVTDSKNGPKSGRFLEVLGSYDARDKNETVLKEDKIKNWISKGAGVSDTVHNILVSKGIIDGKKKNVLPKKSPIVKESEETLNSADAESVKEGGSESASESTEGETAPAENAKESASNEAEKKVETLAEESKEEASAEEKTKDVSSEASSKEEAPEEEKGE